jgi:hypothetical protein
MAWLLLTVKNRRNPLEASMKKKFIIAGAIALLFCVVIVNSIAGTSGVLPFNSASIQQSRADSGHAIVDNAEESPFTDLFSGKATALLNMLLIGLALVGLASFRESKEEQRPHQIDHNP